MTTRELYNQFKKELTEHLEDWIAEEFASKIDKIDGIEDIVPGAWYDTISSAEKPIKLFVNSYSIEMFEKNLKLYKFCKEDFFEIIVNNFVKQFMIAMYKSIESLSIKFDKNLDPKVLEMIIDGRRHKSNDKNDEPF